MPREIWILEGRTIDTGLIINLGNLNFEADSSILIDPQSFIILDSVFRFMEEYPTVHIEVRGHTSDGVPKGSINLVYSDLLSQERAEEVTFYLASRGIAAGRMHYKGYGLRKPITTNLTQEGRRKNQRVDIKIIKY